MANIPLTKGIKREEVNGKTIVN